MAARLTLPHPPPVIASTTAQYSLFFDGGSRGNPGPGGAGAVIIRVDELGCAASLVWSAAMSLAAKTTTNNRAEYYGLLTGLRAAARHRWTPLDVVGDSFLVLRQMAKYRPPRHPRLRRLYDSARRAADMLNISKWCHHLRAWNKMADSAANIAMDSRRSLQSFHPTERSEWRELLSSSRATTSIGARPLLRT